MAEFTRTKAFAALADIFQLPGSDSLRLVDIAVATPVVDLSQIIRSGVGQVWSFARNSNYAMAGSQDLSADPFVAGDWNSIFRGTEQMVVASDVTPLPADHEALILSLGVAVSTTSLDLAEYDLVKADTGITIGTIRVPLWTGDIEEAGVGGVRTFTRTNGTPYLRPPPWFLGPPADQAMRPRFLSVASGAVNVCLGLVLLAAPRGVLPAGT